MIQNMNCRTITREQFLFNEMRIVAKLLCEGKDDKEIVNEVVKDNLFQYPTEKTIDNLCKVCLARFHAVDSNELISIVAYDPSDVAKQACLYIMMNYYRIVRDFMITVIGEKFRTKDMSFTKMDINSFFTRMQEQNDTVASWSNSTINKSKQVLKRLLVENGYLDNNKSETLNRVLIEFSIKDAIEHIGDREALIAFGCM